MVTHRSAELLWAARERGTVMALAGTFKNGGIRKLIYRLQREGLLNPDLSATEQGLKALEAFQRKGHPVKPLLREDVIARLSNKYE